MTSPVWQGEGNQELTKLEIIFTMTKFLHAYSHL